MKKNIELELIKLAVKGVVSGENSSEILGIIKSHSLDWRSLSGLIAYHELAPLIYFSIKDYADYLPIGFKNSILNAFNYTFIDNSLKVEQFEEVSRLLMNNKIQAFPIKGIYFILDLYANMPFSRPMVDIDILIREEDLDSALLAMEKSGYLLGLHGYDKFYWRKQYHIELYRGDGGTRSSGVEVHWALDYKKYNKMDIELIINRKKSFAFEGKIINILSPEDNLISLALHQRRFGKSFCMKYLLDVFLILKKYPLLDVQYINYCCRRYGISSSLYFLLEETNYFTQTDIADHLLLEVKVDPIKRTIFKRVIENNMNSVFLYKKMKINFLKLHFLIYDNYFVPFHYILTMPVEQFAKFYDLKLGNKFTGIFYHLRLLYILIRAYCEIIRKILNQIKRLVFNRV